MPQSKLIQFNMFAKGSYVRKQSEMIPKDNLVLNFKESIFREKREQSSNNPDAPAPWERQDRGSGQQDQVKPWIQRGEGTNKALARWGGYCRHSVEVVLEETWAESCGKIENLVWLF